MFAQLSKQLVPDQEQSDQKLNMYCPCKIFEINLQSDKKLFCLYMILQRRNRTPEK